MKFFACIILLSITNTNANECCAQPVVDEITCPSELFPMNSTVTPDFESLLCCNSPNTVYDEEVLLPCTYFDHVQSLPSNRRTTETLPLHITQSGADKLWAQNFRGEGIVIGLAGTGVNIQHEALVEGYLGNNGDGTFTHDNAWFDANEFVPTDVPNDQYHIGTHMTSTILGRLNNVGVAPEAKYIHCKVFEDGSFNLTPEAYTRCLEWFLERLPDIVLLPQCDSCVDSQALRDNVNALLQAGVIVVSESGSTITSGLQCNGIRLPPGTYQEVVTVAALDIDTISSTSNLGPALEEGVIKDYIKPDGTIHGTSVSGAVYLNGVNYYFPASGGLVASAVVTGSIALLINAVPSLRGDPMKVMEILHASMDPIESTDCNSDSVTPNYVYGYGKFNLVDAVQLVRTSICLSV